MFLEHALVRGEYQSRGAFQAKNRELLDEVVAPARQGAQERHAGGRRRRCSRSSISACPESVTNGKTFEAWREQAERKDPELLCLSLADVLGSDEQLSPEDYPDELHAARRGAAAQLPLRPVGGRRRRQRHGTARAPAAARPRRARLDDPGLASREDRRAARDAAARSAPRARARRAARRSARGRAPAVQRGR